MSTPAAAYDNPSPLTPLKFSLAAATGVRVRGPTSAASRTAFCPSRAAAGRAPGTSRRSRRGRTPARSSPDRPDQARDRKIVKRVGADLATHLVDRAAGRDELLRGADVNPHEARISHWGAGDTHVNLARPGSAKPLDDAAGGGGAGDRDRGRGQPLSSDRAR